MLSHVPLYKRYLTQTTEEESHVKEVEGSRVREKRSYATDFDDGGRVHESRNITPEAAKGEETNSPLVPPKGGWPGRHLGFSPVKLTLNFWPPEL